LGSAPAFSNVRTCLHVQRPGRRKETRVVGSHYYGPGFGIGPGLERVLQIRHTAALGCPEQLFVYICRRWPAIGRELIDAPGDDDVPSNLSVDQRRDAIPRWAGYVDEDVELLKQQL
jgi:hypothetical protein